MRLPNTLLPQPCGFKNEIRNFLADRLDPPSVQAMESHLKQCESCRRDVETWGWIQRNCIAHREVAAESAATLKKRSCQLGRMRGSRLFSLQYFQSFCGLVLMVMAALGLRDILPLPDFPSEVARDYREIREGTLDLERYGQDPKELDQFFSRCGVPFGTRVADLRDQHYRLVGGRVHQLINRRSTLYLYRGRSGEILLCELYVGTMAELPSGGLLRESPERTFLIFRDQALSLVFWQDGNMICVLASDINFEQLLEAAQAEERMS